MRREGEGLEVREMEMRENITETEHIWHFDDAVWGLPFRVAHL